MEEVQDFAENTRVILHQGVMRMSTSAHVLFPLRYEPHATTTNCELPASPVSRIIFIYFSHVIDFIYICFYIIYIIN